MRTRGGRTHRPAAPHGPARPDPVEAAERAFRRNGFVLLVGDRQVEDLDGTVDLTGAPEITFIRLVPLAGG